MKGGMLFAILRMANEKASLSIGEILFAELRPTNEKALQMKGFFRGIDEA